jgi:hypothetical protein
MINIVIGIIFILGGLTGKLTLIFTGSSVAITVVGAGLVIYGAIQTFGGGSSDDQMEAALEEEEHDDPSIPPPADGGPDGDAS